MEFSVDNDSLIQPPQIMGRSTKILRLFRKIKKMASKDLPVLISGEGGMYKELVAKAIHYNSMRHNAPFVAVNLASVPAELAEAELFGYEKTAFTGATERRPGKIAEANGGTLFLDEISEADLNLQEKLCRFVENKEVVNAAGNSVLKSDVRVISSTSKNLKSIVSQGQFREDLYHALEPAHIIIPPLRERREDILPLAKNFLTETVKKFETGPKEFSKDAREFLIRYDWPGNIRELENIIKRVAILSNGAVICKKDIQMEDVGSCSIKEFLEEKLKRYLKEMTKLETCNLYNTVLSEVERALISIVLEETGHNQLKAAKTLGINRNTLRAKIKEYKIRKK